MPRLSLKNYDQNNFITLVSFQLNHKPHVVDLLNNLLNNIVKPQGSPSPPYKYYDEKLFIISVANEILGALPSQNFVG